MEWENKENEEYTLTHVHRETSFWILLRIWSSLGGACYRGTQLSLTFSSDASSSVYWVTLDFWYLQFELLTIFQIIQLVKDIQRNLHKHPWFGAFLHICALPTQLMPCRFTVATPCWCCWMLCCYCLLASKIHKGLVGAQEKSTQRRLGLLSSFYPLWTKIHEAASSSQGPWTVLNPSTVRKAVTGYFLGEIRQEARAWGPRGKLLQPTRHFRWKDDGEACMQVRTPRPKKGG